VIIDKLVGPFEIYST